MEKEYKAEEVVVFILKELSKKNPVSLSSFASHYMVSKASLARRFSEVVDRFYKDDVYYDERDKCWFAKQRNFLEMSFLQPEEAVILNGILRNSDHFGMGLSQKVHMLINYYIKRGYLASLQPEMIEEIEPMQKFFALFESAIKSRRKVQLYYIKEGVEKSKKLLPLRLVNMEYYWYIVGEIEEGLEKEIRYFRMKKIVKVEILDEYFEYSEFRALYHTIKDANKGMNAFYQPYKKSRKIKVIMPEWFEEHIRDVPYFNTWEKTGEVKILEEERFLSYTIISTDEEYRDVIPAIQKYMPHIVVCNNKENQELIELMRIRSQMYARIFEGS